MTTDPLTHEEYARKVGAPRVVACDIDLGWNGARHYVWYCRSHEYGFNKRDGLARDRCPISRLEEWRARRWEAA
jgi:hypothetical protein